MPTEAEAQDLLRAAVTDEEDAQPVIATLLNLFLSTTQDHAVVVLNIRQGQETEREVVEYMDPLTGEIERDSSGRFWQYWYFRTDARFHSPYLNSQRRPR